MGYTHYWSTKDIGRDQVRYTQALNNIATIVYANRKMLANGMGDLGSSPEIVKEISFNGIDREGHETFWLPVNVNDLKSFDFCKTAYKKYDIIVVACLCVLNDLCGDFITVSSDGESEDWSAGHHLAEKILERKLKLPNL